MLYDLLSKLIAIGTLIIHLVLILFLLSFIYEKLTKRRTLGNIKQYLSKNSIIFSFIIATLATLTSLIYSEWYLLEPCNLCWYQRVFIYPLSIMYLVALIKKDSKVRVYALPLAVIGALIALYHYSIQMFNISSFCDITSVVPCNIVYIIEFGYITIPLMSLTAFVVIILLNLKK